MNQNSHGPLEQLTHNLWRIEAQLPSPMTFTRALTIGRLEDGRLLLHNGIALPEETLVLQQLASQL